jgi:hypothetical protein
MLLDVPVPGACAGDAPSVLLDVPVAWPYVSHVVGGCVACWRLQAAGEVEDVRARFSRVRAAAECACMAAEDQLSAADAALHAMRVTVAHREAEYVEPRPWVLFYVGVLVMMAECAVQRPVVFCGVGRWGKARGVLAEYVVECAPRAPPTCTHTCDTHVPLTLPHPRPSPCPSRLLIVECAPGAPLPFTHPSPTPWVQLDAPCTSAHIS